MSERVGEMNDSNVRVEIVGFFFSNFVLNPCLIHKYYFIFFIIWVTLSLMKQQKSSPFSYVVNAT
jgi:hypothetical protein